MRVFRCNKFHWDTGYKFKDVKNSFAIMPKQSVTEKTLFAPKTISEVQHQSNGNVIVMVEEWFVAKFEFQNQVNLK